MKNIDGIDPADDAASYMAVVKVTRKPQKPHLLAEQARVELILNEYLHRVTTGTVAPLGFVGDVRKYHYKIYDSTLPLVLKLKSDLVAKYAGHTCPYCQLDDVSHIDHYLPRGIFPELSISLQNLVMSCDTCNSKYKKENWGTGATQEILHPRYNNLAGQDYLEATATYQMSAVAIRFSIRPGLPLSQLLNLHFDFMHLNTRYVAKVSANEIPKLRRVLHAAPDHASKLVRLQRMIDDQIIANALNSWEHAFYSSLQPLVQQIVLGGL